MNGPSRRTLIRLGVLAATLPFATFSPSFAAESPPLAIKGYDPVAYFTLGAPTRGLTDLEYDWDEQSLFVRAR
jgi:hypothetical protein